jgi:hypothetical protein
MSKNLLESLGSRVPLIGKCVDDIAQGIGAGFMTSVAGHAAMYRCRAFRPWDEENAKESLRNHMRDFYADIRDIFKKDILHIIMNRVGDLSKENLEKIRTGISAALGETGNAVASFVKVPVSAATTAGKAGKTGGRAVGRKAKNIGLGILRVVKSTGGKTLTYSKNKMRTIGKLIHRKKEQ